MEDLGLIPQLGRSPGEAKGYPLQYSGLENSMDCTVHGVAKSQIQLSDFPFQRERERKQFIIRNWHIRFWRQTRLTSPFCGMGRQAGEPERARGLDEV